MATIKQVLQIARPELGVKESPPNSNRTKYGRWFALDGYPWCMMFVQWVFAQAGMPLPCRTASCSTLLRWFQKNQPARVTQSPEPGDFAIYNFGHTGIVESVAPKTITAIEGNTAPNTSGSQNNGGEVCRKTRKRSLVTAFIRPDYQKEVSHMDNTPSPAHKSSVDWAVQKGILTGDADGDLMLSQSVTRQQFCTMLLRFAKLIGKD